MCLIPHPSPRALCTPSPQWTIGAAPAGSALRATPGLSALPTTSPPSAAAAANGSAVNASAAAAAALTVAAGTFAANVSVAPVMLASAAPVISSPYTPVTTFSPDVVGTYLLVLTVATACESRSTNVSVTFSCNEVRWLQRRTLHVEATVVYLS